MYILNKEKKLDRELLVTLVHMIFRYSSISNNLINFPALKFFPCLFLGIFYNIIDNMFG